MIRKVQKCSLYLEVSLVSLHVALTNDRLLVYFIKKNLYTYDHREYIATLLSAKLLNNAVRVLTCYALLLRCIGLKAQ